MAATKAVAEALPAVEQAVVRNFKIGQKELFLPNATITLLRADRLGPHWAKFRVPLYFSKLDLRDYLWHAYLVKTKQIRSYVKQSRVQSGRSDDVGRPALRRWFRPKAQKFMTVELSRPFVWPEEPEDLSDWDMEAMKDTQEDQKKMQKQQGALADTLVNTDRRESMREQAKALLEGKTTWKPPVQRKLGLGLSQYWSR